MQHMNKRQESDEKKHAVADAKKVVISVLYAEPCLH
jgi:hypothetical protein